MIVPGPSGGKQVDYAYLRLSADQETNVATDDHVEWDVVDVRGTSISVSAGSGQAAGLVTLDGGKRYVVYSNLRIEVNEGVLFFKWRDNADDSDFVDETGTGDRAVTSNDQANTDACEMANSVYIFSPSSGITVKLDNWAGSNLVRNQTDCHVLIKVFE